MTVAEAFASLVEFDPTLLGVDEEIMSIIPTFSSGDPRAVPRPDVIMFLRGAASAPTAKQVGNAVQNVDVSDATIAGWYARFNPSGLASSVRHIPTYTFGRSGLMLYMNVITVRSFASLRVAVRGLPDPVAEPMHFISAAHAFARGNGFVAGTPSFLRDGDEWEILGFGSEVRAGRAAGVGWTFQDLPVHTDSLGIDVALEQTGGAPHQLAVFSVLGEEIWQHRPGAATDRDVRVFPAPGASVPDRWEGPLPSVVSAAGTPDRVAVSWGDFAWFAAERPPGSPTAFTTTTITGRVPRDGADRTSGIIGAFNSLSPDGEFAAALQSRAVGRSVDTAWDESVDGNLLLAHRQSSAVWDVREVDGDVTDGDRMLGRAGESSVILRGVEGNVHAFYSNAVPVSGGGTAQRLRHAVFDVGTGGWSLETLDGSGQATPPVTPGTGRIRASVGLNPTAAVFDDKLWVVYEDLTNGNLRCAVGTSTGVGYDWSFSILDGSRGWQRTPHPVSAASMVVWEDRLSVFYVDIELNVLRHASRVAGASRWRYEVVDGRGGIAGRVHAKVASVTAIAAGRDTSGRPARPLHAVYTLDRSDIPSPVQVHNIRMATLS